MRRKGIKFGSIGLAVALIATLVLVSLPTEVNISQSGFLSLSSNIALAVGGELREAGIYETSWGYEYVLAGGDTVEVGDKSTADFKPTLKLNRWDGECFVTIQPAGEIEEEVEVEVEGDKIKCNYKVKQGEIEFKWETEFYPLEPTTVIAKDKDGNDVEFTQNGLGGFEFEIILKKKPKTNQIVLNIETQGLKFYYQPPLTQQEIEQGAIRPDNVVGSYAVYHATRTNMHRGKADAEKYKCGIAFHIYRPKITDADGNWLWGELSIDEKVGTLTTTIPQEFLDKAVFPVSTGTTTFGFTGVGGSTLVSSSDQVFGTKATPESAGTATSITFYLFETPYDDGPRKLGLYRMSDNIFIEGTAEYSSETPGAWVTHDLESTPSILTIEYAIVHWGEEYSLRYNSVVDAGVSHDNLPYPDDWPSPITWTDSDFDNQFSIYCTYEEAGAEISNTPSDKAFGILEVNTYSSTAINHFTIENTGSGAVDVVVYATDLTGGDDTWDLSDTATPGENIYGLKAGLDDDDDLFDVIVRETEAYNELVNNLLESATQDWGLRIYMPSSVTDYDGQQMSATLTLVCSAH